MMKMLMIIFHPITHSLGLGTFVGWLHNFLKQKKKKKRRLSLEDKNLKFLLSNPKPLREFI